MERRVIAIIVGIFVILGASMPIEKPQKETDPMGVAPKERLPLAVPRAPDAVSRREETAPPSSLKVSTISDLRQAPQRGVITRKLEQWAKDSSAMIESNGVKFKILGQVRALPENEFHPADGNIIERRGNFILFEATREIPMRAKFVVYNEATKRLGVITGAVQIALKNKETDSALAVQYGLTPIQSFESLKLAFYQTEREDLSEITAVVNQLKEDPRVERVELDILDRTARTR